MGDGQERILSAVAEPWWPIGQAKLDGLEVPDAEAKKLCSWAGVTPKHPESDTSCAGATSPIKARVSCVGPPSRQWATSGPRATRSCDPLRTRRSSIPTFRASIVPRRTTRSAQARRRRRRRLPSSLTTTERAAKRASTQLFRIQIIRAVGVRGCISEPHPWPNSRALFRHWDRRLVEGHQNRSSVDARMTVRVGHSAPRRTATGHRTLHHRRGPVLSARRLNTSVPREAHTDPRTNPARAPSRGDYPRKIRSRPRRRSASVCCREVDPIDGDRNQPSWNGPVDCHMSVDCHISVRLENPPVGRLRTHRPRSALAHGPHHRLRAPSVAARPDHLAA